MFCKRKQYPHWRLQVQVLELPCCLPMLVLKLQLAGISFSCECALSPLPSSQQIPSLTVFYESFLVSSILPLPHFHPIVSVAALPAIQL
jgi:hypothetical protein